MVAMTGRRYLTILCLVSLAAVGLLGLVFAPRTEAATAGWATWYDDGPGFYGAAGPALRKALGPSWRGRTVTVCSGDCIRVRLTDWCACGDRHGRPTVIDLSPDAFRALAPLSAGVIAVTIDGAPVPTLPPTDT